MTHPVVRESVICVPCFLDLPPLENVADQRIEPCATQLVGEPIIAVCTALIGPCPSPPTVPPAGNRLSARAATAQVRFRRHTCVVQLPQIPGSLSDSSMTGVRGGAACAKSSGIP